MASQLAPWWNPPANAGDRGHAGLIPGSEKSQEMATHASIPAWGIPQTEEPGVLQPMGLQSQIQLSN